MDEEFQFFLYLARPYAAMLTHADDRTRIAAWLQSLCTIQGDTCSSMRAIRNDYMMALLGYDQICKINTEYNFSNLFQLYP